MWRRIFGLDKKTSVTLKSRSSRRAKTLWGEEFKQARNGLDEAQVIAYVERLNHLYNLELEKLQKPLLLSEFASSIVLTAEALTECFKEEQREHSQEKAARLIFQAEMYSKKVIREAEMHSRNIIDEAKEAAALGLREATRLSIEVIEKSKDMTVIAEDGIRQQLLPQMVNIHAGLQASLQEAIKQAYRVVFEDLMGLEHKVQSMGNEQESAAVAAVQDQVKAAMYSTYLSGPVLEEHMDVGDKEHSGDEEAKTIDLDSSSPGSPVATGFDFSSLFAGANFGNQHDSNRDEIREQILESLQRAAGLNGHLDALQSDKTNGAHREQEPSHLEMETLAKQEYRLDSALGQSMYQGDLEFVMLPQRDELRFANQLELLGDFLMALKEIPGASVLETGGSENGGNYIIVHFANAVCLDDVLKNGMKWEEVKSENGPTMPRALRETRLGNGLGVLQRKQIRITL